MGTKFAAAGLALFLWAGPVFAQNGQEVYTRADMQRLSMQWRSVVQHLEAALVEQGHVNQSLQVQLASERDWSGALQEHNKVLGELVGGKKRGKLDWVWWGVKAGGTLFTACELTSIC